jgi:hypothetical protein
VSWLSKTIRGVGPLAGAAASFLPGPWGAAAGALGALGAVSEGKATQKKADALTAQRQQAAQADLAQIDPFYRQLLPQLFSAAGLTQGGLNENYADPFHLGNLLTDPYGDNLGDSRYRAYAEDTGRGFDTAAASLLSDLNTRPGLNSGVINDLANLRTEQGNSLAGARRDLRTQGQQEAYERQVMSGNTAFNRLASLLPAIGGIRSNSLGTLGGVEGLYASEAQGQAQGLAGLLGTVANSGLLDNLFGNKKRAPSAGQSTLNTNNSATPAPSRLGQSLLTGGGLNRIFT